MKQDIPRYRCNTAKRFLRKHNCPAITSCPFLGELIVALSPVHYSGSQLFGQGYQVNNSIIITLSDISTLPVAFVPCRVYNDLSNLSYPTDIAEQARTGFAVC